MINKPGNPRVKIQPVRATRDFAQSVAAGEGRDAPRFKRLQGQIILDQLDFWLGDDAIARAIEMWDAGASISEMAQEIRGRTVRAEYETLLLLVHLDWKGRLKPRPGGLFGVS